MVPKLLIQGNKQKHCGGRAKKIASNNKHLKQREQECKTHMITKQNRDKETDPKIKINATKQNSGM